MAGTASTNSAPRASLPGLPGFKNPVFDTQRIFRRLMRTMSLPGTVVTIDGIDKKRVGIDVAFAFRSSLDV